MAITDTSGNSGLPQYVPGGESVQNSTERGVRLMNYFMQDSACEVSFCAKVINTHRSVSRSTSSNR